MIDSVVWMGKNSFRHVLAVTLMVATLPLLFLGGLVTSHEVGMAVPDWPTTFEENMFTFNFLDKSYGIKLEHTHRLAGSVIGLIALALKRNPSFFMKAVSGFAGWGSPHCWVSLPRVSRRRTRRTRTRSLANTSPLFMDAS